MISEINFESSVTLKDYLNNKLILNSDTNNSRLNVLM